MELLDGEYWVVTYRHVELLVHDAIHLILSLVIYERYGLPVMSVRLLQVVMETITNGEKIHLLNFWRITAPTWLWWQWPCATGYHVPYTIDLDAALETVTCSFSYEMNRSELVHITRHHCHLYGPEIIDILQMWWQIDMLYGLILNCHMLSKYR